ncbi:MAG: arsenate reductase, glutathione/glutaredoxin type [Acaryochloris sp. RU_4_1]|nr:arsenate reductase, glutathione/glutaredoxin type [Acaryochloris sp. RU_4_1]NJR53812.1 arsenate reductase, glutathione/glutaredoxin type [Acaryochloris sp. CRU_2_0]
MKRIMFVCKHNSRRSQMAQGFAEVLGEDAIAVASAGLEASSVDPLAIQVMQEIGIDISHHTSNALDEYEPEQFDAVISLCGCGVDLPQSWVNRPLFTDWQLDDPAGQSINVFRNSRDQIQNQVKTLMESFSPLAN